MSRSRERAAAFAVAAVLLVTATAGCANPPDPCRFVTTEELRAAFDRPFEPGHQVGTVGSMDRTCWWSSATGYFAAGWEPNSPSQSGMWGWYRDQGWRQVANLGDQALISADGMSLEVRYNSAVLTFSSSALHVADEATLIDLARKALERV